MEENKNKNIDILIQSLEARKTGKNDFLDKLVDKAIENLKEKKKEN